MRSRAGARDGGARARREGRRGGGKRVADREGFIPVVLPSHRCRYSSALLILSRTYRLQSRTTCDADKHFLLAAPAPASTAEVDHRRASNNPLQMFPTDSTPAGRQLTHRRTEAIPDFASRPRVLRRRWYHVVMVEVRRRRLMVNLRRRELKRGGRGKECISGRTRLTREVGGGVVMMEGGRTREEKRMSLDGERGRLNSRSTRVDKRPRS